MRGWRLDCSATESLVLVVRGMNPSHFMLVDILVGVGVRKASLVTDLQLNGRFEQVACTNCSRWITTEERYVAFLRYICQLERKAAGAACPSAYLPCIIEYALSNRETLVARPKSEDKRNAILDAATRLFAERGLTAAPTSAISKQAGVAEGTLFTYFETKDDLINALYREIKLELADAIMSDFPRKKNVRTRLRHIWDRYVNWGIANPRQRKVLAQLQVSEVLTKESKDATSAPFVEFQIMIRDAIAQRVFRNDLPAELISKSLAALVEATIDLTVSKPSKANKYRDSGFQMFWAGITK